MIRLTLGSPFLTPNEVMTPELSPMTTYAIKTFQNFNMLSA